MQDYDIRFKDNMFVYAAEDADNPTSLKVFIPEVFLDKRTDSIHETRLGKGNLHIFLNENPPALSNSIISKNYIELPVISSFTGSVTMQDTSVFVSSGIGKISKGDRLLALFIGNSPDNGIIIARC